MNFFGHAAVAAWRSGDPSFVLGAMLPDFASMIRARPPETLGARLSAGVAFHHATDELFHDVVAFRELCGEGFEQLSAAGLARGSARAVAHVGVEILLDGVLADERAARRAYLTAIGEAAARPEACVWQSALEARAFRDLIAAMQARGVSRQHTSPAVVALRVERALAGRPRLALQQRELPAVEAWADAASHSVRLKSPAITAALASFAASTS